MLKYAGAIYADSPVCKTGHIIVVCGPEEAGYFGKEIKNTVENK